MVKLFFLLKKKKKKKKLNYLKLGRKRINNKNLKIFMKFI